MKPIILWKHIPPEKRITLEFLQTRVGYSYPNGNKWAERILRRIANVKCQAATEWEHTGIFQPCGISPMKGQKFCYHHGGKRPQTKSVLFKKKVILFMIKQLRKL